MEYRLPEPDSIDLKELINNSVTREIYGLLFSRRGQPITMPEIRTILHLEGQQEHLDRRVRDLYGAFEISRVKRGNETTYELIGRTDKLNQTGGHISKTVRAYVLRAQLCAQCGRTPLEDGVKLHVDHILPQAWGGTDDPENLQPLCSECNEGKKNYYSSFNEYADQIQLAATYAEPHRRMGELLKAFNGTPVPSELLEVVANSQQYQDDWQKRLRELREIGWRYRFEKRKEGNRFKTYYILEHFEPWPEGSISSAIRIAEETKRQQQD